MKPTKTQPAVNTSANKKKSIITTVLIVLFIVLASVGQRAYGKYQATQRIKQLRTSVGYDKLQNEFSLPDPVRTDSCSESYVGLSHRSTCFEIIDRMYYAADEQALQKLYSLLEQHLTSLKLTHKGGDLFRKDITGEPSTLVRVESHSLEGNDFSRGATMYLYTSKTVATTEREGLLDFGIQQSALAAVKSKPGYVLVLSFESMISSN